jgi:hypothetical protein
MERYDESVIKEKFKDRKFSKNLTFEKLYLQKMILKALRNYHGNNEESYVTHFADIEILIEKGLPDLLYPIINKYKSITKSKDQWLEFLMFTRYEHKNAAVMQDAVWFQNNLTMYAQQETEAIEQLQLSSYLKNTYNLLILLMRKIRFSNPKTLLKEADSIFNTKKYNQLKTKLTGSNLFFLHVIYNTYLSMTGGYEKALKLGNAVLQQVYTEHAYLKVGMTNYLLMANNHTKNAITDGHFSEAKYHADKMYAVLHNKEFALSDAIVKPNVMNWIEASIMTFTLSGDFDKAIQYYDTHKKIISGLGKVGGREFKTMVGYYKALSAFGSGNFNDALTTIGDVKEYMQERIYSSEAHLIPILYIMIHLELGNSIYIENFLRSTKRFYKNQQVELRSITLMHKIFTEYIRIKAGITFKEKCASWLQELYHLCNDYYDHNFIRKLLFRQWLLAKYHNLSMEKIVRDDAAFFMRENRQKVKLLLYETP